MTTTEAALRDALADYVAFASEVAGTSLGLAMSTDHPAPDTALMGMFEKSQVLAAKRRAALSQPSPASSTAGEVIALVIAAREAWEENCVSGDALDKALEPFAALVPYENEPETPNADAREERFIVIRRDYLTAIQETSIRAHMARLGIVDAAERTAAPELLDAARNAIIANKRVLPSKDEPKWIADLRAAITRADALSPSSGEPASVAGEAVQ